MNKHAIEYAWIAARRDEYMGKWIALDGEKLLASGATAREVYAAVHGHQPTPLVMLVHSDEPFFAGWTNVEDRAKARGYGERSHGPVDVSKIL